MDRNERASESTSEGQDADIDDPKTRTRFRFLTNLMNVVFIAAFVPNILAGSNYLDWIQSEDDAEKLMALRYTYHKVIFA